MLESAYALLAVVLSPLAAQAALLVLWVAFAAAVRLAGLHHEIFTTCSEDGSGGSTAETVVRRLSISAWGMTCRTSGQVEYLGEGLFISREYHAIGWQTANSLDSFRGRYRVWVVASRAGWDRLVAPEAEDARPAPAKPPAAGRGTEAKALLGRTIYLFGRGGEYERALRESLVLTFEAQVRLVRRLCEESASGVCALVCGPAGTGKTALADLVALALSRVGLNPTVVRGYSPATYSGLFYGILNAHPPRAATPLILCLDEFDIAIERILSGQVSEMLVRGSRNSPTCDAADKAGLTSLLDRFASIPNLVVLATSNRSQEWWDDPARDFVCRRGRFDLRETLAALSPEEARVAFVDAALRAGILVEPPPFDVIERREPLTAALLSAAFKRARGDPRRLLDELGGTEPLAAAPEPPPGSPEEGCRRRTT